MYTLDHALDATNSSSMKRNPAPKENLVRGKSSYFPFMPGGLDPTDLISQKHIHADDDLFPLEKDQLLTIPSGMERGLVIDNSFVADQKKITTISDVISLDFDNDFLQDLLRDGATEEKEKVEIEVKVKETTAVSADGEAQMVDELIPVLVICFL
jgi:antiviral helicase SKI2